MDPYEILGVAHDATEEEIKIAYRKLAKQYHPDTNLDEAAREEMYRINKAYELLQHKDAEEENWDYMGYSFDKQNTMESYTPGKRRLLQNPVFQRVVLLLMIGSMLAINLVAAFFRAGSVY